MRLFGSDTAGSESSHIAWSGYCSIKREIILYDGPTESTTNTSRIKTLISRAISKLDRLIQRWILLLVLLVRPLRSAGVPA
jgi:hypothetical protein